MIFERDTINKIFLNSFLNKKKIIKEEIEKEDDFLKKKYLSNKLFFMDTDDEEKFKKNLKIMPRDWRYRNKEIIYNINSYGYRTCDFENINWRESIVLFGCSFIFGIGLSEDETLAYKIEKLTGRKVINLSLSGYSNDFILYNYKSLINKYSHPYAVVIGWTNIYRYMFFKDKNTFLNIGPWILNKNYVDKNIINIYSLLSNNYKYNFEKNNINIFNTIKALSKDRCKQINFSLFYDTSELLGIDYFVNDLGARDLMHCGNFKTTEITNYVFNKLNE